MNRRQRNMVLTEFPKMTVKKRTRTQKIVEDIKATAAATATVENSKAQLLAYLRQEGGIILYHAVIKEDLEAAALLHHMLATYLMLHDVDVEAGLIQELRKRRTAP